MASERSVGRQLFRWVRVVVALALLGFLAWRAGIGDLSSVAFEPVWLIVGMVIVPLAIVVRAYNHSLLLNRPDHVIGLSDMTRLTIVGVGINLFLPMGAADLAKAHYGYRLHGHPERMVISSVLDKVTSLTAVALLGVAGSLFSGQPLMALLAGAVALASLIPFVAPRWMPWRLLLRFLAPKAEISEQRLEDAARAPVAVLLRVYSISLVGWVLTYAILWACCLAVGAEVGPAYVFALAPFATLARLIPISAGGIGLGEVTMAALLVQAGVPTSLAALAALLHMVLVVLLPGGVGVILLALGRRAANESAA